MASSQTTYPTPPASGSARINVGTAERLASAVGGAALLAVGLRKRSVGGTALALTGGALVARGLTGHCPVNKAVGRDSSDGTPEALDLTTALTIAAPRDEVYAFWRRLENLPRFMEHLREVRTLDDRRSHWTADVPGLDATLEWDAEITDGAEGERLAWRSVPDSDVENAGEVRFRDAPGDLGTAVAVRISYRPPAGAAGRALGKALGPVFRQMVKEDVRRFKHIIEAGEVPTTEGQPAARDDS